MKALEENYISVIVVIHNDDNILELKLIALNNALKKLFKYYEIIIVDNYSTDKTDDILESLPLPLTVITLSHLHNIQTSLTAGIELAIGDYLIEISDLKNDIDFNLIEQLYELCQQGNDFVFLSPKKLSRGSFWFYYLLNKHFKGQLSERFVSSIMTLSSRRGQNKTTDVGSILVNRNISYVLTGLKCFVLKTDIVNSKKSSLRDKINLMIDTLIYHTDYISGFSINIALFFISISILSFIYAVVVYLMINTTPGWATQFILTSVGFGVLFALLATICKYLSNIIKYSNFKRYIFRSIRKLNINQLK